MEAAIKERAQPSRPGRWRLSVSIRALLVLVALVALGLTGYRRYRDERAMIARHYSVADLIPHGGTRGRDYSSLLTEIKAVEGSRNWFGPSGKESAVEFLLSQSVIVQDNRYSHEEIAALLTRKRSAIGWRP